MIRDILEELVWEVSVGEVELNAVESSPVDSLVGGGGIPLGISLDFFDSQRTGGRVGRRDRDGGWADEFVTGVLRFQ